MVILGITELQPQSNIQVFRNLIILHQSVQSVSSVTQSCPTLCNPMNHSTPGLPVHHQLPEFTQTHIHWVSDAIQPSHSLSSPSPPVPNPSQHQSLPMSQLFAWGGQSSFSFSIIPSKEISGLISFRTQSLGWCQGHSRCSEMFTSIPWF